MTEQERSEIARKAAYANPWKIWLVIAAGVFLGILAGGISIGDAYYNADTRNAQDRANERQLALSNQQLREIREYQNRAAKLTETYRDKSDILGQCQIDFQVKILNVFLGFESRPTEPLVNPCPPDYLDQLAKETP